MAYGKVTKSSRRGMFGKAGKLEFTCDYLLTKDGIHVPLRSSQLGHGGRDNTGTVVATALFLSVLGVFINGRDVVVPKGQQFSMYVDQSTAIAAPIDASHMATIAPATATPAATPGKSLFTLTNGDQVVGSIASFDGATYQLTTDKGPKSVKSSEVKSIYALK